MRKLVSSLLFRALRDWAAVCRDGSYLTWGGERGPVPCWQRKGFEDARAELEAFFRSEWCRELADFEGGYVAYLQTVKEIKDSGGVWNKRRYFQNSRS